MKSILKRIKGGLAFVASYGVVIAGCMGLGAGLGTGGAYLLRDDRYTQFYENEQVQEIVQDTLKKENEELETQFADGEITESEYKKLKHNLDDNLHKHAIEKKP